MPALTKRMDFSGARPAPFNLCDFPYALTKPLRLTHLSAWHEHIPFAFFLIEAIRPRVVVELGSHSGDSYCAFCQAMQALDLHGTASAIDLWQGDAHTSSYGREVLEDLRAHHDSRYGDFSSLHQMCFDDALPRFADESIDLLHIDGLHTYKAVQQDFASWLPKMSPSGLMLFHDIGVRRDDFGVWRLWEELRARYPYFEFSHGHGLGLLAVGPAVPERLQALLRLPDEHKAYVRQLFAALGERVETAPLPDELRKTAAAVREAWASNTVKEEKIARIELVLESKQAEIANAWAANAAKEQLLHGLEEQRSELQSLLDSREQELASAREELERAGAVTREASASAHLLIESKQAEIDNAWAANAGKEQLLNRLDEALAATERTHRELTDENEKIRSALATEVSALRSAVREHETKIANLLLERSTFGAKVGRGLTRSRARFAPPGTTRDRIIGALTRTILLIRHRGMAQALRQSVTVARLRRISGLDHGQGPQLAGVAATPETLQRWIAMQEPTAEALAAQRADVRTRQQHLPLISVLIPVYNVPGEMLLKTAASLHRQTYPNWEACIAYAGEEHEPNWQLLIGLASEDPRIKLTRLAENRGISGNSNAALAIAAGEFVGLLDHDDELAQHALYEMARALNDTPSLDFLYSDKDSISQDSTLRMNALFKPAWSPEMLYSVNYLTHFNVIRRSLVNAVGGFRSETDGAQDWDLFLRVTERTSNIARVPGILYHWRVHSGSVSTGLAAKPYATAAQFRALREHVQRSALHATIVPDEQTGFHLKWHSSAGLVADLLVIVERCDGVPVQAARTLQRSLSWRIRDVTVLIDHDLQGTEAADPAWWHRQIGRSVALVAARQEESRTELIARTLQNSTADALIFFSSLVSRASHGLCEELLGWVWGHPHIGFSTAVLLDDTDHVIEAGLVVAENGDVAPLLRGSPLYSYGWFGGALWHRNCRAASPIALAMSRAAFLEAGFPGGGRDFGVALAAMTCRMVAAGRRGVVVPHARVYLERAPDYAPTQASFASDPYFHPAFCAAGPLQLSS
ncbi:MAG: class I SAM-dependent methyltransferase [Betaproteobacteria bacterium]